MLRKFNQQRSLRDNIQLGALTAFVAGTINVTSLMIFFAFTSNVTGHYAILASEIARGNLSQAVVVLGWIMLFFLGGFLSNLIVINLNKYNKYVAHSIPLVLEIICVLFVGFYGDFYYQNTLQETELLVGVLLLAMGLQNGLTASISNFQIKTTHLTGATTDMAILCAMFSKKEYRSNIALTHRAKLLAAIFIAYISGAIAAGILYQHFAFKTFYAISFVLFSIIYYDFHKISYYKVKFQSKEPENN